MLDVLQTQTENFEQPKNDSIASESLEKSRVFRSMHFHYTAILVFFSEVLHEIWRIFPRSFDIVVISNVPTRYLIFCTKQTRKQSLFYWQHPECHVTFPECLHFFSAARRVFVWKHRKVCCSLLQWRNVSTVVWCRTCTVRFFRSLLRLFSSFSPIWVCEMKVLRKVASSRAEDLKPVFLYLVKYSVKDFITTRQYLVNLTCNCWFRMCTQFHKKLVSYKCMLFVDCLVVLQEYFVNWARVTKLQVFFPGNNFRPESYVRRLWHTTVVVMWHKTLNF